MMTTTRSNTELPSGQTPRRTHRFQSISLAVLMLATSIVTFPSLTETASATVDVFDLNGPRVASDPLTDFITLASPSGSWGASTLGTTILVTSPTGKQLSITQTGTDSLNCLINTCQQISFSLDGRELTPSGPSLQQFIPSAWGTSGDLRGEPRDGTWAIEVLGKISSDILTIRLTLLDKCGEYRTNGAHAVSYNHLVLASNNPQFFNFRQMVPGCFIDNVPTGGNTDNVLSNQENPTVDGAFFWDYHTGSTIAWSNPLMRWDFDLNGMADVWTRYWETRLGVTLTTLGDLDGDGLSNQNEFRWLLIPACAPPAITNCQDYDEDSWMDGAEVAYWNNPANDAGMAGTGLVLPDSDSDHDADGDGTRDVNDADSDNDGLADGTEKVTYGLYPEYADSDCAPTSVTCTLATSQTFYSSTRAGIPGSGDAGTDAAEQSYWGTSWNGDADSDGIINLMDADSDNDLLLDGHEIATGQANPADNDTENDGVFDSAERNWNGHNDGDGLINANDADSDGDSMPDGWEITYGLNPLSSGDASEDGDDDGLTNSAEYSNSANPTDPDSENDLVKDGPEVNTHSTDPLDWDSDSDGMPDYFELKYSFNPNSATDASGDADADFFDTVPGAPVDQPWTNLQEYRHARPTGYVEALAGPWLYGTNPRASDTDGDGASDGFEAYYVTDPVTPSDPNSDLDNDGLIFTDEFQARTDPTDADTDNDGVCDGGLASACSLSGTSCTTSCPGERDYGTRGLNGDTDYDGLSDLREAKLWDSTISGAASDVDADGANGLIDSDADGDALTDGFEKDGPYNLDPSLADSDGDQLNDGSELNEYGTLPDVADSDNDQLTDGAEVLTHKTKPRVQDSDLDGLSDGAEVQGGLNPLSRDTDGDGLPDQWEVQSLTQPTVADADSDPDFDTVTNVQEYSNDGNPLSADSDGDGMPDPWEYRHRLLMGTYDASSDADLDGMSNLQEYSQGGHPRVQDTDQDGLNDGPETAHQTSVTDPDSDDDGLSDGAELARWDDIFWNAWTTNYDGDAFTNNLLDQDSDNDQLDDHDEFVTARTSPDDPDSDNDQVNDYQEVVTYGGKFNPRDADTDDDGQTDGQEVALETPQADPDEDGLTNTQEINTYLTDYTIADTDCDGVKDGPEANYWGTSWNSGGNRLLVSDWDGDTLADGIEMGHAGGGSVQYRTNAGLADTDSDGLTDDLETKTNAKVTCNGPSFGAQAMQGADAGPALISVLTDLSVRNALPSGQLLRDMNGAHYSVVDGILYSIGSYGATLTWDATSTQSADPVPNTNCLSSPLDPDSDDDGLSDKEECEDYHTDPKDKDTDDDGVNDGTEAGKSGYDADPTIRTDPKDWDTDGDGLSDGVSKNGQPGEDPDGNGHVALQMPTLLQDPLQYCAISGETNPKDLDTDDDGLRDDFEATSTASFGQNRLDAFCFDSDHDGSSDGLENRVAEINGAPPAGTRPDVSLKLHALNLKTWQPWKGGTNVASLILNPDSDADGLLDGLEDWDHNGIYFGQSGANAFDLNPQDSDTDGDDIGDGREARIFLLAANGIFFPQLMNEWKGAADQLKFDPGNLMETDPRSTLTDGDLIPDGLDLNPRANAQLQLQFGRVTQSSIEQNIFKVFDDIDCCFSDQKKIELFMKIKVDLPTTEADVWDISFRTPTTENLDASGHIAIPNWGDVKSEVHNGVPSLGLGSITGGSWKAARTVNNRVEDTKEVMSYLMDIPDDISKLDPGVDLENLKVRVQIELYDNDQSWYDALDMVPGNGDESPIVFEQSLTYLGAHDKPPQNPAETARKYMAAAPSRGPYHGDGSSDHGEDAELLGVVFGTSALRYFTEGLDVAGIQGPPISGEAVLGAT